MECGRTVNLHLPKQTYFDRIYLKSYFKVEIFRECSTKVDLCWNEHIRVGLRVRIFRADLKDYYTLMVYLSFSVNPELGYLCFRENIALLVRSRIKIFMSLGRFRALRSKYDI